MLQCYTGYMSTYSYKDNTTHTDREAGDTGVNHVRKQTACEDEVHTDRVVEALTNEKGRVRQ
jgi:hypothetical protein